MRTMTATLAHRHHHSPSWRAPVLALGLGACLLLSVPGAQARALHSRGPASPGAAPEGMSFHSQPGLHPPTVTVTSDPDAGSGDIFLTPRNSYQRYVPIQHGPMILNGAGQLVWFDHVTGTALDLLVQSYRGQPVLTWTQRTDADTQSSDVIVNQSYQPVAVIHAARGYSLDGHEFRITPQNTALIDAVDKVQANLRGVGGPRQGVIDDDVIQEIDIATGRLLWEWHSYGHVPLRASYTRPAGSRAWDYFHLNSIERLPDGNLLVSARNTWGIYEISRATGRILWTLGGKQSSFRVPVGARFSWQHDARLYGQTLSLFDDASDGPSQQANQSSAKYLSLNLSTMTATLVRRYNHSPSLLTPSQGSTQTLLNGDVFVGWGADPEFSEYSPTGQQIFSGSFALGVNTYRAYRFAWTGRPATPPAIAVSASGTSVTVYASWNGATQVAAWRVLAGDSPSALTPVTEQARSGFETTVQLTSSQNYFAVQALDANGNVLGTSPATAR